MVILSETLAMNPNPGETPLSLSQDFTLALHQLPLAYTRQAGEVASPVVSSTSHPEPEISSSLAMVQLRGSTCTSRQPDNIGSIITMLINEQNVDIDDILTEEQYRQDSSQLAEPSRQELEMTQLQLLAPPRAKIKEELPGLSEQLDYSYPGPEYSFHVRDFRQTGSDWVGLEQSNLTSQGEAQQGEVSVASINQEGRESRDEKYWERRRKNNLAAKKSRDTRRVRENQLRLRVLFLENANKVLREEMERKDLESGKLRERLSGYESEQNCHFSH